jgi:hypothetical protein
MYKGAYTELKLISRLIQIDSKDDRCRRIEVRVVNRGYIEAGRKFYQYIALYINVDDVNNIGRKSAAKFSQLRFNAGIYLMHGKMEPYSEPPIFLLGCVVVHDKCSY